MKEGTQRTMLTLDGATARARYLDALLAGTRLCTLPIGPQEERFAFEPVPRRLRRRFTPLSAGDAPSYHEDMDPRGLPAESWNMPAAATSGGGWAHGGSEALRYSATRRLALLGNSGMGKTTELASLLAEVARRAADDTEAPLPILIFLPDWAGSGLSLRDYLGHSIPDVHASAPEVTLLWDAIISGDAVIGLDGLDDVPVASRAKVLGEIATLSATSGSAWIVTSRYSHFSDGALPPSFVLWELLPWRHAERVEAANRMVPAAQRLLAGAIGVTQRTPDELVALLERHDRREWGQIPLWCALAATVYTQTGTLPVSGATLLHEAIAFAVRGARPDPVQRQQLTTALAELALTMREQRARRRVSEDMLREPALRDVSVSGLLRRVSPTCAIFSASEFADALAATALSQRLLRDNTGVRDADWQNTWSRRLGRAWAGVLSLLPAELIRERGAAGATVAHTWLGALLAAIRSTDGDPGNVCLSLALRALAEIPAGARWDADDALATEAARMWARDIIGATHAERPRQRRHLLDLGPYVAALPVRATGAAIAELQTEFSSPEWHARAGAIAALATLGRRAPFSALTAHLDDPEWRVRRAVVLGLGRLGTQAGVPLLMRALSDDGPDVRVAAITALAQIEGTNTALNVIPLISALRDEAASVRDAAANALQLMGEEVPLPPEPPALPGERHATRDRAGSSVSRPISREGGIRAAAHRVFGAFSPRREAPTSPIEARIEEPVSRPGGVAYGTSMAEALLVALNDSEPAVRAAAAHSLGQLAELDENIPVESLVEALRDDDDEVRLAVARALGCLSHYVPADRMLRALRDRENWPDMRAAAGRIAGACAGVVPTQQITALLTNRVEWHVRLAVVQALQSLGAKAPLGPFEVALADPSPAVRAVAAAALGSLGTDVPLEMFVTALRDYSSDVRLAAAHSLGARGGDVPDWLLAAILQDRDPQVRIAGVEAFAMLGSSVPIDPLLALLDVDAGATSGRVRAAAISALASFGDQAPHALLLDALRDADWQVRVAAAATLRTLGQPVTEDTLIALLRDSDADVRVAAVETVGAFGVAEDRAVASWLLDALRDRDWRVRQAAAQALEMLEAPEARGALVKALRAYLPDPLGLATAAAARALAVIADADVVRELLGALSVDTWQMRAAAAEAVGMLGDETHVPRLVALLDDAAPSVRAASVLALASFGSQAPLARLVNALADPDADVRVAAVRALGALGSQAPVIALTAALGDGSERVRIAALEALGVQPERAPIERLVMLLGDSDDRVRQIALRVVRAVRPEALVPVAQEALALLRHEGSGGVLGSVTQCFIAETLGLMERIPDQLSPTLVELLTWPYWEVRLHAAVALGRLQRNIPDAAIRRLLALRSDPDSRAVRLAATSTLAETLSLDTGIEDM